MVTFFPAAALFGFSFFSLTVLRSFLEGLAGLLMALEAGSGLPGALGWRALSFSMFLSVFFNLLEDDVAPPPRPLMPYFGFTA